MWLCWVQRGGESPGCVNKLHTGGVDNSPCDPPTSDVPHAEPWWHLVGLVGGWVTGGHVAHLGRLCGSLTSDVSTCAPMSTPSHTVHLVCLGAYMCQV